MKLLRISAVVFLSVLFTLIALLWVNRLYWRIGLEGPPVKNVTIPEGLNAVEISRILQAEGILINGEALPQELDGYLFPDTYEFFVPSTLDFVVRKISGNFNSKVLAGFPNTKDLKEILIVASMVEEEVVYPPDREIVAGIIWKRLKAGYRLQIDSTICYIKDPPCYPIRPSDLDIDSHYNTYLYYGLPPGPISNPGLSTIEAAQKPRETDYWYYITDPETKKAVFAETLEEHNANVARYLK